MHEYTKKKRAYRDNCTKVYTVVLAQCSQATEAKLEARDDRDTMKSKHDLVGLLKALKSLLHNQLQNDSYSGMTAYESTRSLFRVRQARHEKTTEYRKRFRAAAEVLDHVGVTLGAQFQGMADEVLKTKYEKTREDATDEEATNAETEAGNAVLAVMFLKQACPVRYGEVVRELQNDFLKSKNNYPVNVTAAYARLSNWHSGSKQRDPPPPLDGVAYSIADERPEVGTALATGAAPGRKRDLSKVRCNNCSELGHLWRNCPKQYGAREEANNDADGTANAMFGTGTEGDEAVHP